MRGFFFEVNKAQIDRSTFHMCLHKSRSIKFPFLIIQHFMIQENRLFRRHTPSKWAALAVIKWK